MVQDDLSVLTPLLPLLGTTSPNCIICDHPPLLFHIPCSAPWQPWRSRTATGNCNSITETSGSLPFYLSRALTPSMQGWHPAFPAVAVPLVCAAQAIPRLCFRSKAVCSSDVWWSRIAREPSVKLISVSEEKSWMKSFPASPTKTAHQLLQWI